MLARADIPIVDIPFVSIGGGIGSFVTVDYLRICGVPTSAIRVFTQLEHPVAELRVPHPRLPDPARRTVAQRLGVLPGQHLGLPELRAAGSDRPPARSHPLKHVLLEPIFDDYWTPKAGQAFDAMEQEYHRIRYPEMVVKGQVRMVRRRMGGGYFTILTPPAGATRTKRVAYRSRVRARRRRLSRA